MADSSIGALPQAPQLDDDSLLVAEQQGQAMKVTGAQFKEFGRQAVIGQVQSYVDEAQAAAKEAVDAVSAVTEMTVEAHASETATVTKSTRAGKVNLDFGLPQGERGEPGPEGQTGPRGPQGPPGNGLTILGHYDTEEALRSAVTAPDVGDAYGVGEEDPYDTYIFDGVTNDWKNYGPLSGGGGSTILPENVVTSEGGASLEIPALFGGTPHTIVFTDEEEPPLTAGDIVYGDETVKEAIDGLFTSVSDGKALIASAVTDKGVPTAPDAAFAQMAENIGQIQTGGDTSDATATPGDILAPKTAYTASGKVEGIIPSLPAQTITPGTADKTIANGQYLSGAQTIKGDPNLTSSNIKKGVSLFGVAGALESSFTATLTVTADIGAVVTATCGDTSVEALSTTGSVVLELPIEGTWKVTAQRGMAQYNTATIVVSSQYSAELTAELFIEYYKTGTPLSEARSYLAATTVGNYALFGGGGTIFSGSTISAVVDAYNINLAHTTPEDLIEARGLLAATTVGNYALFGGGHPSQTTTANGFSAIVDAYNEDLVHSTPAEGLLQARRSLAAATIGDYALFGGGEYWSNTYVTDSYIVDAYNKSLTRSTPTFLSLARTWLPATNVGSYALFGGKVVDAYNKSLTRSTPDESPQVGLYSAATNVGNYALFGGGVSSSAVDAYDDNLTRISAADLSSARGYFAATSVMGYALFGGGSGSNISSLSATVDIYDETLTRTTKPELELSLVRRFLAAATIGPYAIFAGGESGAYGTETDIVDIYRRV